MSHKKSPRNIQIALLGLGTVGSGVEEILRKNEDLICRKIHEETGVEVRLHIEKILVLDKAKKRPVDPQKVTTNFQDIMDLPIDIIVELIGGKDEAREFILKSLDQKRHVVTANKLVIADLAGELEQIAKDKGIEFLFEAAVAGAIPIVRTIKHSLSGDRILEIEGIVNGTTNYILGQMDEGRDFEQALRCAQEEGFAESDPTLDVEGQDALYKISILSALAWGTYPKTQNMICEGITKLTKADIEQARSEGKVYKLIARALYKDGEPTVEVRPIKVHRSEEFASVTGAENMIRLRCEGAGMLVLKGAGAGRLPTASAVLADILQIAKKIAMQ